MASPPVPLYVRIRGTASYNAPVINASSITLGAVTAASAYMVFPAGEGDLTWQGGVFGLSAPAAGGLTANVWQVAVTVSHFCSDPSSFSSVTAQIYDTNTSTVVASKAFTLSATLITETVTMTSGYPAADVPDLAVQLTWHQIAVGYASVAHAYGEVSYSYSNSIGSLTVDPVASIGATTPTVIPLPKVSLVSAGSATSSLSPSFGQPTTGGDLLIAWIYANSSTFDISTAAAGWLLAGHAGSSFDWVSLWYKPDCSASESPPVFTSGSASTALSGLMEFSGARFLDQAGGLTGSTSVLTITAAGPDTASGDLVVAFAVWGGGTGSATVTMTGKDSYGAAMSLSVLDNAASMASMYWATGWGQASAPAGPGMDAISTGFGVTGGGGGGMVASFKALATANLTSPFPPAPVANRVIIVPIRIG
jgi:hypothetical protein